MRTKVEIERSLAEMKRMADDARRGLAKAKEMNATVLVRHFEQWETKCEARAQILSWVLGEQELSEDVQPVAMVEMHTAGAREATNPEVEQCKKIVDYIDDLSDEDYDPGQALMDIRTMASKGLAATTPLSSSSGDAPFNDNNSIKQDLTHKFFRQILVRASKDENGNFVYTVKSPLTEWMCDYVIELLNSTPNPEVSDTTGKQNN
jgi:hypothetical protein